MWQARPKDKDNTFVDQFLLNDSKPEQGSKPQDSTQNSTSKPDTAESAEFALGCFTGGGLPPQDTPAEG